jgi:hypothetical protein
MPPPHAETETLFRRLESASDPGARCRLLRELADRVGEYDLARSLALERIPISWNSRHWRSSLRIRLG